MLFTINTNGSIDVSGVVDYELLVITDDIVPNKKYVDDAIASGGTPSVLGYLWSSAITVQPVGTGVDTLVIGERASANNSDKSIVIGKEALANTGATNAITIGDLAECSSTNATAIGRKAAADHLSVAIGNAAVALGDSAIAIAVCAEASATNSVAIGREAIADREGEITFSASSNLTSLGDVRASKFILFNETDAATETELFINTASTARVEIASDSTMTFRGLISARRADVDGQSAGFSIEGVIDNNAGVVGLVGTPTVTSLDDAVFGWSVAVSAGGTALLIKVTGEALKTIRWTCSLDTCESRG